MDYLVLPIVDGAVPLLPHVCIVLILDVHSRVVGVVSHLELAEFLSEKRCLALDGLPELRLLLFLSDLRLLPLDEASHGLLLFQARSFPPTLLHTKS